MEQFTRTNDQRNNDQKQKRISLSMGLPPLFYKSFYLVWVLVQVTQALLGKLAEVIRLMESYGSVKAKLEGRPRQNAWIYTALYAGKCVKIRRVLGEFV